MTLRWPCVGVWRREPSCCRGFCLIGYTRQQHVFFKKKKILNQTTAYARGNDYGKHLLFKTRGNRPLCRLECLGTPPPLESALPPFRDVVVSQTLPRVVRAHAPFTEWNCELPLLSATCVSPSASRSRASRAGRVAAGRPRSSLGAVPAGGLRHDHVVPPRRARGPCR